MIPESFSMMGRKYRVFLLTLEQLKKRDFRARVEPDDSGVSGWTNFDKGEVYILEDPEEDRYCKEQSFFHELNHVYLFHMGYYNSDDHDERDVDLRGSLQHQYEKTKRGELTFD